MESSASRFPPEFFLRDDESSDAAFYQNPRLVTHIDERAAEAVRRYLDETLPTGGAMLDLMSSWRSHLPESSVKRQVVGLGMNEVELAENPQLDVRIVHDLNADPVLPLESERLDAAVVTVSIQYLVRPVEVFREVRRVLKENSVFHVIFSDRMFPTKAVSIWRSLRSPERRGELITAYFSAAGGWSEAEFLNRSPSSNTDPVYVVRAARVR